MLIGNSCHGLGMFTFVAKLGRVVAGPGDGEAGGREEALDGGFHIDRKCI